MLIDSNTFRISQSLRSAAIFVAVAALPTLVLAHAVPAEQATTTQPSAPALQTTTEIPTADREKQQLFPSSVAADLRKSKPPVERPQESKSPISSDNTTWLIPLAFVIGLICICALVFKRVIRSTGSLTSSLGAAGRAPSGILDVLGRYPLPGGHMFILLKIDTKILLLAFTPPTRSSPGGYSTLTTLDSPDDVASILIKVSESQSESPSSHFNSMLNKYGGGEAVPTDNILARLRNKFSSSNTSWDEAKAHHSKAESQSGAASPGYKLKLRAKLASVTSGGAA